jgi:hypothetical protein
MNRIRLVAACAVALASVGTSYAATIYVATTGTDSTNCGSSSAPCRHIQFAIDKAQTDGDIIRVKNGTYAECFIVPTPGSGLTQVTVESDAFATGGNLGSAILDGAGVCDLASGAPGPVVVVLDRSVVRGFKIQHGGDSGVWGFGAVAITNNTITGNSTTTYAGGIFAYTGSYISAADTKLAINDNTISSNTSVGSGGGLYVFAPGVGFPSVVEIKNNTLTGNVAGPDPGDGAFGAFGGAMTIFTDTLTTLDTASVVITNNTIDGNTAHKAVDGYPAYGGGVFAATGIYLGYGTETVEIGQAGSGNSVRNNTTEGYGGGISANLQPGIGADHTIKVAGNSVSANSGERGGGGIHGFFLTGDPDNGGTGTVEITDNAVTGNHASGLPGSGVLGGGGIFAEMYSRRTPLAQVSFDIERNDIQNNDSKSLGGGASLFAYADDDPEQNGVALPTAAEIDFRNNLVAQNSAVNPGSGGARGGGIWAAGRAFGDQAVATIDLDFLTVVSNHTDSGAGGIELEAYPELDDPGNTLGSVEIELSNSIIANNEGFGAGGPITPGGTVSVDVRYNDSFQNDTNWEANLGVTTGTNGNVSVDPGLDSLFVPQLCSATIDAGDPAASFDLEPQPNGGRVNMGHLGGTANATRTLPDSNGDGIVDGIDILKLAVAFGSSAGGPRYNPAVDFDADGNNDGNDLSYLASLYARSCP